MAASANWICEMGGGGRREGGTWVAFPTLWANVRQSASSFKYTFAHCCFKIDYFAHIMLRHLFKRHLLEVHYLKLKLETELVCLARPGSKSFV